MIYTICHENRGQSDSQCQGSSAAEVTFDQGLEEPVVIGGDERRQKDISNSLCKSTELNEHQTCLGTLELVTETLAACM